MGTRILQLFLIWSDQSRPRTSMSMDMKPSTINIHIIYFLKKGNGDIPDISIESHDGKAQNPATHPSIHPFIHSFNKRIQIHRLDNPLPTQRHSMTIEIMKRPHALLFIHRSPPPNFSRSRISYTILLDIPHLYIVPRSTSISRPGARFR